MSARTSLERELKARAAKAVEAARPWRCSGSTVAGADGRTVAVMAESRTPAENRINGELMAAAPELLAALLNLVEAQRSGLLVLSEAGRDHDYLTQALNAIERAGAAPLQPVKTKTTEQLLGELKTALDGKPVRS